MGMEHLTSAENPSSGSSKLFPFLRYCFSVWQTVTDCLYMGTSCKRSRMLRGWNNERNERATKAEDRNNDGNLPKHRKQEWSDQMSNTTQKWQASPPYFMGSPPVRASNPLVHDTEFCAWKVQSVDQSLGIPIPTKGYGVRYCVREGSVTKA